MTELEVAVRKHLPPAVLGHLPTDSTAYHREFRASGQAKAEAVLEKLGQLKLDLTKCAYFSVGGSFGSEIVTVMQRSPVAHGLLLDFDPAVGRHVNDEVRKLELDGRKLEFIGGDATQQIDACRAVLQKWHDAGEIRTVICSAQAIFHELPTRSPGFHLSTFLHKLVFGWHRIIFFCREPVAPADWPRRVEISIAGLAPEVLRELAEEIQRHLSGFGGVVRPAGQFVEMSASLAVETLVKVFYVRDLRHELQERVTALDATKFATTLGKYFGSNAVSKRRVNSDSFEELYRAMGVTARRPDARPLPLPLTFCEFFADSRPLQSASSTAEIVISNADQHRGPIGPEPAPKPAMKGSLPRRQKDQPTHRYLRRRCRVMVDGSSTFQRLIQALLSRKYDQEQAKEIFRDEWNSLEDPYERLMTEAASLEGIGKFDRMRAKLEETTFVGSKESGKESSRQLYRAIALEKLDKLPEAQRILYSILSSEKRPDIVRAAQFNLSVCFEKLRKFNEVRFSDFIADTGIVFIDGERLSDKAVAMQLIVCMETGDSFLFPNELKSSLRFLLETSRAGYAKTLLTAIAYDGSAPTPKIVDQILDDIKFMDTSSRVAVLYTLLRYMSEQDVELRPRIEELLEREGGAAAVEKWKRERAQV